MSSARNVLDPARVPRPALFRLTWLQPDELFGRRVIGGRSPSRQRGTRIGGETFAAITSGDTATATEVLVSSHADVAASAHLTLGFVRLAQDRRAEVRAAFVSATGPGSAEVDMRARFALTKLAAGDGDLEEAVAQLSELLTSAGSPHAVDDNAGAALVRCCDILLDANEIDAATEILTEALAGVSSPGHVADPDVTVALQAMLGRAAFLQRDYERARDVLEETLAAVVSGRPGDPPVEPLVRRYLASTLAQLGRTGRVRELLRPLVESDDTEHRPAAQYLLGMLDSLDGHDDEAATWFGAAQSAAVAADDVETAEAAATALDELRSRRSLTAPPLPPAPSRAGLPTSALAPLVRVLLGELAAAEGNRTETEYWVDTALASDVEQELRSRARLTAALAAFEAGDSDSAFRLASDVVEAAGAWSGRARRLLDEAAGLVNLPETPLPTSRY